MRKVQPGVKTGALGGAAGAVGRSAAVAGDAMASPARSATTIFTGDMGSPGLPAHAKLRLAQSLTDVRAKRRCAVATVGLEVAGGALFPPHRHHPLVSLLHRRFETREVAFHAGSG